MFREEPNETRHFTTWLAQISTTVTETYVNVIHENRQEEGFEQTQNNDPDEEYFSLKISWNSTLKKIVKMQRWNDFANLPLRLHEKDFKNSKDDDFDHKPMNKPCANNV